MQPSLWDISLVYTLCCFVQPNYPSLLLMGWSTKLSGLPPSFRVLLLFFIPFLVAPRLEV